MKLVLAGAGGVVLGAVAAGGIVAIVEAKKDPLGGKWTVTKDKMLVGAYNIEMSVGKGAAKLTTARVETVCSAFGAKAFYIDPTGSGASIYTTTPDKTDDMPGGIIGVSKVSA